MRALIADRNARLLEAISRTFGQQFSIQTATSHAQCNELLSRGEFGLALISEKLADGPGLYLLGQIARNSPGTLRVLAARRSRLQLLQDKLGPFGLFRTLSYPIDPQELLAVLTQARTALRVDVPPPAAVPARPSVERISLTSADAIFLPNVPKAMASIRWVRRPIARVQARAPDSSAPVHREPDRSAPVRPPHATRVRSVVPEQPVPKLDPPRGAVTRLDVRPRLDRSIQHTSAGRKSKVVLAATVVMVFLVTTLTMNVVDTSVHVTHASAPRPGLEQPQVSAPHRDPTPLDSMPTFHPAPSVAQRVAPQAAVPKPDVEPTSQVAASITPIAEPSSFGSEAYEAIYSD